VQEYVAQEHVGKEEQGGKQNDSARMPVSTLLRMLENRSDTRRTNGSSALPPRRGGDGGYLRTRSRYFLPFSTLATNQSYTGCMAC
jgi:hypothetical protein